MYWNNTEGQNSGRNVLEILTSGALTGSIRLHLKRTLASSGIGRFYWYAGLWKRVDSKTFGHSVVSRRRSKCFCPPSVMAEWGGLGEECDYKRGTLLSLYDSTNQERKYKPRLNTFPFFFLLQTLLRYSLLIECFLLITYCCVHFFMLLT